MSCSDLMSYKLVMYWFSFQMLLLAIFNSFSADGFVALVPFPSEKNL